MRPYYFAAEPERSRRAVAIIAFERAARGGLPPAQPRRWPIARPGDAVALVRLWRRRARERDQLARLDLRLLRDIGVTPAEAQRECHKPFWRA